MSDTASFEAVEFEFDPDHPLYMHGSGFHAAVVGQDNVRSIRGTSMGVTINFERGDLLSYLIPWHKVFSAIHAREGH